MTEPKTCFDCKCLDKEHPIEHEGMTLYPCLRKGGECFIVEELAKTQAVCLEVKD